MGFGEGIFAPGEEPADTADNSPPSNVEPLVYEWNARLPRRPDSLSNEEVVGFRRGSREQLFFPEADIVDVELIPATDHRIKICLSRGSSEPLTPTKLFLATDPFNPGLRLHDTRRVFDAKVEHVVSKWLATSLPMSGGSGILYRRSSGGNKSVLLGTDIDALGMHEGKPDIVFEVKNTSAAKYLNTGYSQAITRANLLAGQAPEIRACVIQVYSGRAHVSEPYINSDFTLDREQFETHLNGENHKSVLNMKINLDDLNSFGRSVNRALDTDKHYQQAMKS